MNSAEYSEKNSLNPNCSEQFLEGLEVELETFPETKVVYKCQSYNFYFMRY